jgi:hypothetical protein
MDTSPLNNATDNVNETPNFIPPPSIEDAVIIPSNLRTFHNAAYEALDAANRELREYVKANPNDSSNIQRYVSAIDSLRHAIEGVNLVFVWEEK